MSLPLNDIITDGGAKEAAVCSYLFCICELVKVRITSFLKLYSMGMLLVLLANIRLDYITATVADENENL